MEKSESVDTVGLFFLLLEFHKTVPLDIINDSAGVLTNGLKV